MLYLRVDPEIEKNILKLYLEENLSGVEISRKIGLSTSAVYRALQKNNVSPDELWKQNKRKSNRAGKKKFSYEEEKEIADYYRSGHSLNQATRKFNSCTLTIRNILKRHGVQTKGRGAEKKVISEETISDIIAYWCNGDSQSKIGEKVGVAQHRISRILRDNGHGTKNGHLQGERHPKWKGYIVFTNGYIGIQMARDHPWYELMANKSGYVLKHRIVMAEALGRPLSKHETVHHINGDRTDNNLANLQLRNGPHGKGIVLCCGDCGSTNIVSAEIKDETRSWQQLSLLGSAGYENNGH